MQRDPDTLELLRILAMAVHRLAEAVEETNPGALRATIESAEAADLVLRRLEAMGDG